MTESLLDDIADLIVGDLWRLQLANGETLYLANRAELAQALRSMQEGSLPDALALDAFTMNEGGL